MDKKNTAIGLILLFAGFAMMIWTTPEPQQPAPAPEQTSQPAGAPAAIPSTSEGGSADEILDPAVMLVQAEAAVKEEVADFTDESPVVLENDYVRIAFTRRGAAITTVEFKQTDPNTDPDVFIFNEGSTLPAAGLYFENSPKPKPFASAFELVSESPDRVVFQWDAPKGNYALQRIYAIDENAELPYHIAHKTVILNKSEAPLRLPDMYFGLGTAFPLETDPAGQYLNMIAYANESVEKITATDFTGGGGFLGFGKKDHSEYISNSYSNVTWVATKNQYFTSLLIPEQPIATKVYAEGQPYEQAFVAGARTAGVFGAVSYTSPTVSAGESGEIAMTYYIGPKELSGLREIGKNTVELMEFGAVFGWISEGLLLVMSWFYGFVGNWGISIILLTCSIKLAFWWLTGKGLVSMKIQGKKMQGLAEPMKEIREKYKDNPQKLQKEMMGLYKKYEVNPLAQVAGCLPMMIQMPIFFGLFGMLRTASELRLESFLWIQDLASPDRLFIFPEAIPLIGGFSFNLLPILYGATSYFQMRMTPQATASMDEQQLMMQKMMRFMPWIFTIFLYNFASALSLYWIASNLLAILQMYLVNKKIQPQLDQIEAEQAERKIALAKPVKAAKKSKK